MLSPVAAAMAAAVQWVASPGGSVGVRATTRSIVAWDKGGTRGGRVLSRRSPATPSRIPLLPAPDARLGLAGPAHDLARPQAVRRGQDDPGPPDVLLRAVPVRHHPSRRARSAAFISPLIPSRIPATWGRGWPTGILRQTRSTRFLSPRAPRRRRAERR